VLGEYAAVGFGLDFVEVMVEELVVFDHELAADVDAVDVALGGKSANLPGSSEPSLSLTLRTSAEPMVCSQRT